MYVKEKKRGIPRVSSEIKEKKVEQWIDFRSFRLKENLNKNVSHACRSIRVGVGQ